MSLTICLEKIIVEKTYYYIDGNMWQSFDFYGSLEFAWGPSQRGKPNANSKQTISVKQLPHATI